MSRPQVEVADVLRAHAAELETAVRGALSPAKLRVISDLQACRTAALGGHVDECQDCGHARVSYNSCRNRHCPKCQGARRAAWLEAREADLLPVEYFHVVFTLPEGIAEIALQNKKEVYGLLFHASAETLKEVARDPAHLGAEIGFVSVLHTWGQNLLHHPHVHCVVPGGGLSADGERWVSCRPGFFLPVRVLSRLFRGKFLAGLGRAFREGRLQFQGGLASLRQGKEFRARLARARETEWVVYAKPPFGGPEQVLRYLSRYTHRVAIANSRLVKLEDGRVTFRWKDYARGHRQRAMTVAATEFIRRFLLHVLPKGFPKVRHYGLLANRSAKLERSKELLCVERIVDLPTNGNGDVAPAADPLPCCPSCGGTRLLRRELPCGGSTPPSPVVPALDSS
jgi:hypothetical protein